MEDIEEIWKNRWKKMLDNVRQILRESGIAHVASYNTECSDNDCVYDFVDMFAFRTYIDAIEYLKICMVELDVADYSIYYDSGIDALIVKIVHHSYKR
jgi:hypothetical protein